GMGRSFLGAHTEPPPHKEVSGRQRRANSSWSATSPQRGPTPLLAQEVSDWNSPRVRYVYPHSRIVLLPCYDWDGLERSRPWGGAGTEWRSVGRGLREAAFAGVRGLGGRGFRGSPRTVGSSVR